MPTRANQTESGEPRSIEVPLIRAQGHLWVLPTLLYPFGLDSYSWEDEQAGLRARVQTLQEAARQHPVEGEPPQVAVLFWRGVSPEVRQRLETMGVQVERSAESIPLLEEGPEVHLG